MRSFISAAGLAAVLLVAGCGEEAPTATDPEPTPTTATPDGSGDVVPADLDPGLVSVAQAWLRLARGEPGPGLPVAAPVAVLLGGEPAMTIEDADEAHTWANLCGAGGEGYAMRECPIAALPRFEAVGVELTTDPAQEPCSRPPGVEPGDVGATERVTLIAAGDRSCPGYAAVELYVDDAGRLVAADLVLGSP